MAAVGDSTGDSSTEWFGLLGQQLGSIFPNYSILWRQWSDTNQQYSPYTALQVGTAGERYLAFDGTSGRQHPAGAAYNAVSITGDLDLRAKILPTGATGWSGGAAGTVSDVISQYTSNPVRSFRFYIQGDGKLGFLWADGSNALLGGTASSVAVPFANGTPGWVRVTHQVDNGATGNTVTYYTSADGVTWTQLGTAITLAGTTTHQSVTAPFSIGCMGSTQGGTFASNYLTGRVYWVEVLKGINGYSILPPMPEHWDATGAPESGTTYNGAPAILLVSGAVGGTNSTYWDDATRRPKIFAPHGQRVVFINTGHNEAAFTWNNLALFSFKQALADIQALLPGVPIVVLGQNPTKNDGTLRNTQTWVDDDNNTSAMLLTLAAATPGCYPLDMFPAITDTAGQLTDGLHPNAGGETAEVGLLYRRLFNAVLR
jgi:lysophospholipase L1-like esterase